MKRLFLTMTACAALFACSKDDVDSGKTPVLKGDTAYMNVCISDAATRAYAGSPTEFENGKPAEYNVTSAKFYFYDANEAFVSQASVWNSGEPVTGNGNIEFDGNSVVVLRGLTGKTFPKYLVTVLNAPADFQPGTTLDEMQVAMAGGIGAPDSFIMSTTSHPNQKGSDGKNLPYFVTEVTADNFKTEPYDAKDTNPVVVYVERLAAKVTVKVGEALKKTEDENHRYKLNVSVAGDLNDQNDPATDIKEGATDVYIEFQGWALNGTALDSYMMKNIDETWTNTAASLGAGWVWAPQGFHRSYWGMSYNYDKTDGNYPANSADENLVAPEGSTAGDMNSKYLHYITANQINKKLDAFDYCAENTNTATYAQTRSALTSVLLKARICAEDGGELDLIRYNGLLYNKDTYLNYITNSLGLNAYYKSGEENGKPKYTRIGKDYLELGNLGDGKIFVKMKETLPATVYSVTGSGDDLQATQITDFTTINEKLKEFNVTGGEAIAYKGGLMYYNIPIEHLRNNAKDDKTIYEANYGVVRNHHYGISLDKLTKLGKGIADPDEVIIPNVDDEKETYYVGATIHILSWKLVNQSVEL